MPGFEIDSQIEEDVNVLSMSHDLDYGECHKLRSYIDRVLRDMKRGAIKNVVLDLSGIEYLDSSGLGLLLEFRREIVELKGQLAIIQNETVKNILYLTRLTGIFPVVESIEEAKRLFDERK